MIYEVHVKEPARGWPGFRWVRLTRRPLGLRSATQLANSQPHPAVVAKWMTADVVYRNPHWNHDRKGDAPA